MRKQVSSDGAAKRRPVSYANVVSTLALVLAVGGGSALAASATSAKAKPKPKHHYIITSRSQIKPSVAASFQGRNGANGIDGAKGATGPTGATGGTGATGVAGANGAVAGYSAAHFTVQDFTSATSGSPMTILSKNLPAGNFLVSGKTGLSATSTTNPDGSVSYVNDTCEMSDGSAADEGQWNSSLSDESIVGIFTASGSASMAITVSTTLPSTVTLSCWNVASSGTAFDTASSFSTIQALQVNSLG